MTIIEVYGSQCVTDWQAEGLVELANAYCDQNSTLNTADLADQLEDAMELPAGALSAYVID